MKTPFSFSHHQSLNDFFGAYLHQDYDVEYPSAEAALDDFRKKAAPEKFAAFKIQFNAFMAAAERVPFADVQAWWIDTMGSGWMPTDKSKLLALKQRLNKADTK